MVNIIAMLKPIICMVLKLAGISSKRIEIEPGTTMNFWVPSETIRNKTKTNQNKPVLVFIHGFCGDGITTWLFQVLALSKVYDIYVPDLIFFGDSITNRPERSTTFQAECLVKGLRELGVKKCTLVGLSYGGMVSFKLAKLYPDLIESMVISSAVIELTESISNKSLKRIGFSCWSDYLLPENLEGVKILFKIGSHKLPWLPDFLYKHFLEVMFGNRKERGELLEALVIKDEDAMSPHYSQKIDLLWGDDDKIFNLEDAYNMKRRLGDNAKLQSIENSGHILQLESPFIYNDNLKKILASHLADRKQQYI